MTDFDDYKNEKYPTHTETSSTHFTVTSSTHFTVAEDGILKMITTYSNPDLNDMIFEFPDAPEECVSRVVQKKLDAHN